MDHYILICMLMNMAKVLRAKRRECPIMQYSKDGKPLRKFDGIQEAAHTVGVHSTSIIGTLGGKQITSAGYKWKRKCAFEQRVFIRICCIFSFWNIFRIRWLCRKMRSRPEPATGSILRGPLSGATILSPLLWYCTGPGSGG